MRPATKLATWACGWISKVLWMSDLKGNMGSRVFMNLRAIEF